MVALQRETDYVDNSRSTPSAPPADPTTAVGDKRHNPANTHTQGNGTGSGGGGDPTQ